MKCEECGFPLTIDDIEVHLPEERITTWRVRVNVACPNCGHTRRVEY